MKISICYNSIMENSKDVMTYLSKLCEKYSVHYDVLDIENLEQTSDMVFVIGGDGTILKAARFYAEHSTPIFGINLGRLGFLSQTSPANLEKSFENLLAGNYKTERRMMLKAGKHTALNDFVIKGVTTGRTSRFALEINDKFVCEYLADGIIISTPTGSTAYSMAAGGAILSPELEAIAIVPICPHTFSARPIVVSSDDKIKIIPVKDCEYKVAADGQIIFSPKGELIIEKYNKYANLILLNQNDFYSVLRNKLQWGISPAKM